VILLALLVAVKASLAMLLVTSGLAKATDLPAFVESLVLVLPSSLRAKPRRSLAASIVGAETAAGALSLALPRLLVVDLAVLGLCLGFLVASLAGSRYARGRPCRCFGSLVDQRFGPMTTLRSGLLVAGAALVVSRHQDFATLVLPGPAQWGLVVLTVIPTAIALVIAGQVLRAVRAADLEVPSQ
jgi:hypothetical protein